MSEVYGWGIEKGECDLDGIIREKLVGVSVSKVFGNKEWVGIEGRWGFLFGLLVILGG